MLIDFKYLSAPALKIVKEEMEFAAKTTSFIEETAKAKAAKDLKKEENMTSILAEQAKSKLNTAKSEALEATKRVSVDGSWDVLKNGVIEIALESLPLEHRDPVRGLLSSAFGDMLLRFIIGALMEQVSSTLPLKNTDKINILTKELRVQGYQQILEKYAKPFTVLINEALKELVVSESNEES